MGWLEESERSSNEIGKTLANALHHIFWNVQCHGVLVYYTLHQYILYTYNQAHKYLDTDKVVVIVGQTNRAIN